MNRILLAEDDNDMRRFLAKALANAGYDVVSFDNGAAPTSVCARSPSRCCSPISSCRRWMVSSCASGDRTRPRSQDHVHHRLCRRGADPTARLPRTPRCCPSPSISRISSARSRRCWPPPEGMWGFPEGNWLFINGLKGIRKASQAPCMGRQRTLYPRPRR